MAYIQPNTNIYLIRGCELDADYNHTFWFENQTQQIAYFQSLVKPSELGTSFVLSNYTYQRVNKNTIRVGILADKLYDCNYMMFQNTNYGNKWFYAFIREVNYINDNATEIVYSIDVMQTWMWDYKLGNSFVEREHANHDDIGDNLIEENIGGGTQIVQERTEKVFNETTLVVLYIPNEHYLTYDPTKPIDQRWVEHAISVANKDQKGTIFDGVYSVGYYASVDMEVSTATEITETTRNINNLIAKIIDIQGTIVTITQYPKDLWENNKPNPSTPPTVITKTVTQPSAFNNATHTYSYTPKNKKMYTAPYQQLIVSNNNGQTAIYNWEYFSGSSSGRKTGSFLIDSRTIPSIECECVPYEYRGVLPRAVGEIALDYDSALVLNDFPTPPWSTDSFSEWWSVNKTAFTLNAVTSAIQLAGGLIASGVAISAVANAGMAAGGLTASQQASQTAAKAASVSSGISGTSSIVGNSIGSYFTAINTPDQFKGQLGANYLRVSQNRLGFTFYSMGITSENAEIVDKYFTMYGYATKLVKQPNRHVRKRFTYTKTIGCIVHANTNKGLPSDVEQTISSIYDKGITFWVNKPNDPTFVNEIGDYTSPNPIL